MNNPIANGHRRRFALFASFLSGQSALQLCQAFNGLLFVWLLAVTDFAVYAVFTAALGLTSQLLGFGINPTIISLVGPDVANREKVGRYLKAGGQLRAATLAIISPLGIGLLWISGFKAGYAPTGLILLSLALVGMNFLSAQIDLLSAPAQMNGKIHELYRNQLTGEILRGVILAGLWGVGFLNIFTAVFAGLIGLGCSQILLRSGVGRFQIPPSSQVQRERSEILHFVLPGIPNALFGAFQGQIALFLSAAFGGTLQTASVGALGRVARLLTFLNAANPMIIGPSLSRLDEKKFGRRLPIVILLAFSAGFLIAASGFFIPGPLLAVLGPQYSGLLPDLWLLTLGAGLAYAGSVFATIIAFKRWTAWWYSFGIIVLILLAQIFVLKTHRLDTVEGVLCLWVAANAVRTVGMAMFITIARIQPRWLRGVPSIALQG